MSKKKRKNRRVRTVNYFTRDWHHALWQRKNWSKGWAKLLREHEYCGAYIPKNTLHVEIHKYINNIPCPDGKYCHIAFEIINRKLEEGYIDTEDPLDKKLEVLIEIFDKTSPKTAEALKKELEIVKSYKAGH